MGETLSRRMLQGGGLCRGEHGARNGEGLALSHCRLAQVMGDLQYFASGNGRLSALSDVAQGRVTSMYAYTILALHPHR
jgi:hypothetical protein